MRPITTEDGPSTGSEAAAATGAERRLDPGSATQTGWPEPEDAHRTRLGSAIWFSGTTSFRFRLDADGVIRGGTMNVAEVLGRPLVELLGQPMREFAHPDDLEVAQRAWEQITAGSGEPVDARTRLALADGSWRWFDSTSWNVLRNPRYAAVIVEFRDVQALVETEQARVETARDHDRLVRIFDEVDDLVMVTHLGVGVVYLNRAADEAFGPARDPQGNLLVDHIADDLRRFVLGTVLPDLERMERWQGDIEVPGLRGGPRIFATTATPVGRDDDQIYVGVIMRDVTTERNHARELAAQARRDPLTGLPNRLGLMEHLERCRRDGSAAGAVTVCFIDLDNLKVINDGLGHGAGDLLLRAVADQLDASSAALVARFGGDEFVVVLEDHDHGQADAAAHRMLDALGRVDVVDVVSHVTASVGVASCDRNELDAERLIRDADAAMYVAKRSGRAQVVTFDEAMRQSVARRFTLEASLRRALADGDLEMRYQPIVTVADGRVSAYEALARWDLAAPSEFIGVAEDAGLIGQLGEWALNEALAAASRLGEHRMGVNVSADQLLDASFPKMVLDAVARAGIGADRLVLELTETVLIDHRDDSTRVLGELHDAGITLALDDFGSGYSSLGYLRRYPIDVLKLDNTYTQALLTDPGTRIIVESVLTMARRLGIQVVAEGIETTEQLAAIRELGVDRAQGYLLGRPAPVEELLADPPSGAPDQRRTTSVTDADGGGVGGHDNVDPTSGSNALPDATPGVRSRTS